MGARRIRREQRRVDMARSRHVNGIRKANERERRRQRMLDLIQKSSPPYAPAVLSWMSSELGKPSSRITPEDVQSLLASAAKP